METLLNFITEDEILAVLDESVFECDECGWWFERGMEADDGICRHCHEE